MRVSRFSAGRPIIGVAAVIAGMSSTGTAAHGAIIVNLAQSGSDVVASGSGTISSTGAFTGGNGVSSSAVFNSSSSTILLNHVGDVLERYTVSTMTGPTSFGTGGSFNFTSPTGDEFGLQYGANKRIFLPTTYSLGSSLSGTATLAGQTFSSLGLTPDSTYTWSWGSGASADSFTINVGSASVPEPASLSFLGFGGLALLRRRR